MILKFYELNKIPRNINYILFYGKNEGQKKDIIESFTLGNKNKKILKYEEREIVDQKEIFFNSILTGSLFDDGKIIIINRVTDKILNLIEEIITRDIDNIKIILNSENLEKKSKLRSYFEKEKKCICSAFYPDSEQTLSKLTNNFFKKNNISISQANINLVVNKCNGDREKLFNELMKIEYFNKNGKKITKENLAKLTNLSENHNISELVDNCLAKNQKKITDILNENNFSNEDCILITRTFINKSKKIFKLCSEFENNKNINLTISSARPSIFWKDKEITKQQIYKWSPKKIKKLIYKLSDVEMLIKKNVNNSINLITDFILDLSSSNTNN